MANRENISVSFTPHQAEFSAARGVRSVPIDERGRPRGRAAARGGVRVPSGRAEAGPGLDSGRGGSARAGRDDRWRDVLPRVGRGDRCGSQTPGFGMKFVLSEAARRDRRRSRSTRSISLAWSRHAGCGMSSSQCSRPWRRCQDSAEPTNELDPPGRSFRYYPIMKRFIVVYEPTADGVRVVRPLHGARHLAEELSRDAGNDDG